MLRICPMRFVGRDVMGLVDQLELAGCRLSFDEQERLSPTALEAVMYARPHLEARRGGRN